LKKAVRWYSVILNKSMKNRKLKSYKMPKTEGFKWSLLQQSQSMILFNDHQYSSQIKSLQFIGQACHNNLYNLLRILSLHSLLFRVTFTCPLTYKTFRQLMTLKKIMLFLQVNLIIRTKRNRKAIVKVLPRMED